MGLSVPHSGFRLRNDSTAHAARDGAIHPSIQVRVSSALLNILPSNCLLTTTISTSLYTSNHLRTLNQSAIPLHHPIPIHIISPLSITSPEKHEFMSIENLKTFGECDSWQNPSPGLPPEAAPPSEKAHLQLWTRSPCQDTCVS